MKKRQEIQKPVGFSVRTYVVLFLRWSRNLRLLIKTIYILQNGLSFRRIINLMSYLLYAAFSNKYDRFTGFFFKKGQQFSVLWFSHFSQYLGAICMKQNLKVCMDTKHWCLNWWLCPGSVVEPLSSIHHDRLCCLMLAGHCRKNNMARLYLILQSVLRLFPSKIRLLIWPISNAKNPVSSLTRFLLSAGQMVVKTRTKVGRSTCCRHAANSHQCFRYRDVIVSRTKRISAFMCLSWFQTCDVARSRWWMSLSSFRYRGKNALHYKEWSALFKCWTKKERHKLASDAASPLNNQLFHQLVFVPLAFLCPSLKPEVVGSIHRSALCTAFC